MPADASWHLDTVEVACDEGRPAYFVCRRWLDERNGYCAELAATARNPHGEDVEYKVPDPLCNNVAWTLCCCSAALRCGTAGQAMLQWLPCSVLRCVSYE